MRYVSLWLCGICVFVFILQLVIPGFTEMFLLDSSAWFEPWRFLTAIFLHGGIVHLLYNLVALFFFGLSLERFVGTRKFLFVFFATGIIANIFSINFYDSSLGASGAIFGVIGALIVVRPTLPVFAFGLPMPLFMAGLLWGVGDVIGVFVPSNVANLAHLSGLGVGLIFGLFLRDWNRREVNRRIILDEGSVRRWEDSWMR